MTSSEKKPFINGSNTSVLASKAQSTTSQPYKEFHAPASGKLDFPWQKIGSFIDPLHPPSIEELKAINMDSGDYLIQNYLKDKYYSDFYYNCSLMVGTCLFAWLTARLGGGLFSLGFVLICASASYRNEFRRFNRNLRDDMLRLSAAKHLENKVETMEWLNSFLAKFWVIYMPALSEMVITQANTVLKDVAPPPPIDKLTLDEFTLGTKAPKVDSIKSFTKLGKDVWQMDWDFGFTPNDTDDMTKNELRKKIDPKVALGVRVGKGFVGASLPILVEDMSFKGKMRITMKLSNNMPHIKIVSVSFLEPPSIDYALKPVGGNTFGIDIMSMIPGLSSFVNSLIHANLGPMLYAPNSLDIDVEEIFEGMLPEAIGVLAVNIRGAEYFKNSNISPYVEFSTDQGAVDPYVTDIKAKTNAPIFNEMKYLLVNDLNQKLNFKLLTFDEDEVEELGTSSFELLDLMQKEVREKIESKLTKQNKRVGKIVYDLKWFPVLEGKTLDDGTKEAPPESEVGIFKFVLQSARDLDTSKSMLGKLSTFTEIYFGAELVSTSRVVKSSNEPDFKVVFEKLVHSKSTTPIKILVKDTSSYGTPVIGQYVSSSLNDLIFCTLEGKETISLTSGKGYLRFKAVWKPLAALGLGEEIAFVPPLGTIRLNIKKCENLKNLETFGNIDPYVRVLSGGRVAAQTPVVKDELNPVFDEVVYIPLISENQKIALDCMDVEKSTDDRLVGSASISLQKYIKRNEHGNYLAYEGSSKLISKPLVYKEKEQRGTVYYSISFYPTIPVYSQKELKEKKRAKEVDREAELEELNEQAKMMEDYKKHPNEYEWYSDTEEEEVDAHKKEMTFEQLVSHNTGVLGINIISGKLFRPDCFIQFLLDDRAFPDYISKKSQGRHMGADAGSAFIRDLDNATVLLRITTKENVRKKTEVVAQKEFKVYDLLNRGFREPTTLDIDGNSIEAQFEYVPTAIPPGVSESMDDTGLLSLNIVRAVGLMAADRNGKSDPFVTITVNGVQVYKTEKVKKTLNPVFNEQVTIPVKSRSRTEVKAVVYDWDVAGDNDLLGSAPMDLTKLKPKEKVPFEVRLDTQGSVFFEGYFEPKYMRPELSETGELAGFAGVPLKLVGGAAGFVGSAGAGAVGAGMGAMGAGVGAVGAGVAGVGSVGGGLIRKFGGKKKSSMDLNRNGNGQHSPNQINDAQSVQSFKTGSQASSPFKSSHQRQNSDMTSFTSTTKGSNTLPGRVTVVGLSGASDKDQLQVKVLLLSSSKKREIYKTKSQKADSTGLISWRESVPFKAPQDAKLLFQVKTHHTFGKSTEYGEAQLGLAEVVGNPSDFNLPVANGELVVNFNYGASN
ncbi:hypothetical protein KL929_002234 [Ogataea haglerorum]|uniref:Uncharacterized protein n=1 Tax=Ogataea haglerorum TaxID=1937702 RepID=A0ABQ7RJG9_9ASCO|nr:uncharacterized protein KL911_001972 [Ogataea haglerorum]KAG7697487.1 hypothetical protein KL951_002849 [Ogataea haglerorum]KAG7709531.1 hypothetical protein KL950_001750 [Ogataea haglerorum]KAG7738810.1 hypothetical protein KL932_003703 [Ogataea haglerorum]KAG7739461.1 hypothetical protein KL923_002308 [Ogataea haglerorum]KAG7754533.1 hypothetical protein KL911_001972 [Ogataea haglerorum]